MTFLELSTKALNSDLLSEESKETLRKIIASRQPQAAEPTEPEFDAKLYEAHKLINEFLNPGCDDKAAKSSAINEDKISHADLKEIFGFTINFNNLDNLIFLLKTCAVKDYSWFTGVDLTDAKALRQLCKKQNGKNAKVSVATIKQWQDEAKSNEQLMVRVINHVFKYLG